MITTRFTGILALGGFASFAGLAGLGCSHEQRSRRRRIRSVPLTMLAPPRHQGPAREQATNDSPSSTATEPVIFFDFDSDTLRPEARPVLQTVASEVRGENTGQVRIEGNC